MMTPVKLNRREWIDRHWKRDLELEKGDKCGLIQQVL